MTMTITSPSFTADLRLTPQAKTVLAHLKNVGSISPMEALVTYGISRLAPCIYEIRNIGYLVDTNIRKDERGHKYSNYAFAPTKH